MTIGFDPEALRRVLGTIGNQAKGMKAARLKSKYMDDACPPAEGSPEEEAAETPAQEAAEDGANAAVDATSLPTVADVKAKLAGAGAMDALKQQGAENEALGDKTLDENKAALADLDDEKMKALLASLKQ